MADRFVVTFNFVTAQDVSWSLHDVQTMLKCAGKLMLAYQVISFYVFW